MPRAVLLRFLLLLLLIVAGLAALRWTPLAAVFSGPALAATVARLRASWWAPALLIAGYLALSPLGVPATPLMIAGGVVFGPVLGSICNLAGVYGGGAATYLFGRLLGRDLVVHLAGRRLRRVEKAIGRRGFWSLVGVRFLPLPFGVVNYAMALAGVPPGLFFATTATGLVPSGLVYTYFFALLSRAAAGQRAEIYLQASVAVGLLVLLTVVPQLLQGRRRRARYRALRAARAARAARARLA